MIGKMVILNELSYVFLDELSLTLKAMKIEKLDIFSIDKNLDFNIKSTVSNKGSDINYIEINTEQFVKFINKEHNNFLDNNYYCLYIIRNGSFLDIKKLFKFINSCPVDMGRGGSRSQKSHMLSPLDLRLTTYLMAMFNFNYKLISSLNTFNYISKDRYLSFQDKSNMFPYIKSSYYSKKYKNPKKYKKNGVYFRIVKLNNFYENSV